MKQEAKVLVASSVPSRPTATSSINTADAMFDRVNAWRSAVCVIDTSKALVSDRYQFTLALSIFTMPAAVVVKSYRVASVALMVFSA